MLVALVVGGVLEVLPVVVVVHGRPFKLSSAVGASRLLLAASRKSSLIESINNQSLNIPSTKSATLIGGAVSSYARSSNASSHLGIVHARSRRDVGDGQGRSMTAKSTWEALNKTRSTARHAQ